MLRPTRTGLGLLLGAAVADAVNTDDAPPVVVPRMDRVPVSANFSYEAPANALTILRLSGRGGE